MPNAFYNYQRNFTASSENQYRPTNHQNFSARNSWGRGYRGPAPTQSRGLSGIPLSIPKGGGLSQILGFKGIARDASKFNVSKLLTSAESLVTTVNQVIPIYQQLKPIYDNSKVLRTAVGKWFSAKKKKTTEVIDNPEIIDPPKDNDEKPKKHQAGIDSERKASSSQHQETPNKPFF